MKKIVFVCTGNTCRSPMAQAFFNAAVDNDEKLRDIYSSVSRGLYTMGGEPAGKDASDVMKETYGIDLKDHFSNRFAAEDADNAFLILTMTADHKKAVISAFPGAINKTYTLKEYVAAYGDKGMNNEHCNCKEKTGHNDNSCLDIHDPFGMSAGIFKKCAGEICQYICKLMEILRNE